jgi:drug/metabolite transporter (DMT)-like permease
VSSVRERIHLRLLVPFVLICLIWGSTWLVITGQLGLVPPAWSIAYRFTIAAAVMFTYARLVGGTIRLDREGHGFAILYGIPQFCLNFLFVYLAERHVTSGLVAVVFALLVVPNALLARLFLGQRTGGRFVVGSLIAGAGVGLLFAQELRSGPNDAGATLLGIGLTLLGITSASIGNVIQAMDRIRSHSLPSMIAWGMAYGALANAASAWLVYGPPVFDDRPAYWLGLFYLGIVASALAFSLYFPLVRSIGPAKAAYSSLVTPVIAMLLSTAFEGYRWTPLAATGGVLALAGLFVALRAPRPGPAIAQPGAVA